MLKPRYAKVSLTAFGYDDGDYIEVQINPSKAVADRYNREFAKAYLSAMKSYAPTEAEQKEAEQKPDAKPELHKPELRMTKEQIEAEIAKMEEPEDSLWDIATFKAVRQEVLGKCVIDGQTLDMKDADHFQQIYDDDPQILGLAHTEYVRLRKERIENAVASFRRTDGGVPVGADGGSGAARPS